MRSGVWRLGTKGDDVTKDAAEITQAATRTSERRTTTTERAMKGVDADDDDGCSMGDEENGQEVGIGGAKKAVPNGTLKKGGGVGDRRRETLDSISDQFDEQFTVRNWRYHLTNERF